MTHTKPTAKAWAALACAWLLGFSMYSGLLCVPPMVHVIREEFGMTNAQVGLLMSLPLAALAVAAIPAGTLADRIGIKKATVIGAAMVSAGGFLRGAASDYVLLYLSTGLFGLGFTLIFPNLPKIVHAWFGREKAGVATGIYTTGIALGGTIPYVITLPFILPITQSSQGVFYVWSAPAAVAFVLCWIVLDEPKRAEAQTTPQRGDMPLKVLKDRNLWLASLLMFANCLHFYLWVSWAPSLMVLKGATPEVASAIASMRGWFGMLGMFLVPLFSYRIGLRKPFLWGSGLLLGCAALWAIVMPLAWGWVLMSAVGFVISGSFAMKLALPSELSRGGAIGSASGMILSIGYLGGLIAPWLAGYLFDLSNSLNLPLMGLFVIGLAWGFIGTLLPETGRRASPPAPIK